MLALNKGYKMARVLPIELKEFDATGVDGTWQEWGSVFANPVLKIQVYNTSDVDFYFSRDQTNKYRVPAGGTLTLDESTLYFRGVDQEYYFPKGTQLYVKQVTGAGTEGNFIGNFVTRILP